MATVAATSVLRAPTRRACAIRRVPARCETGAQGGAAAATAAAAGAGRVSSSPAALRLCAAGAVAVALAAAPPSFAALNARGGNSAAYAEMMKKMQEQNSMSVEKLYEKNGGACGDGYELRVEKVIGAKCYCVDPNGCGTGRSEMTEEQRAFGTFNSEKREERGIEEAKPPPSAEDAANGPAATAPDENGVVLQFAL